MPLGLNETDPSRSPVKISAPFDLDSAQASAAGRRFRWRVIPVTLLYIYGACLLASGLMCVVAVFVGIFVSGRGTPIDSGHPGERFPLIVSPGAAALGCLFLYMGRNLWRKQWRRVAIAALPAAAMIGLAILIGCLIGVFR
jgi:hypothetical protein